MQQILPQLSGLKRWIFTISLASSSGSWSLVRLTNLQTNWSLDWGWRIGFWEGSQARLLAGALRTLHRTTWGSSRHSSWVSPEWPIQKGANERAHPRRKLQSLTAYSQKRHTITSAIVYWSLRLILVQRGRGLHKGMTTRSWDHRGLSGGWQPHLPF